MAVEIPQLMKMTQAQLDDLFKQSPAGPIPDGDARSAGDITVVNEKLAFALAVGSPVPDALSRITRAPSGDATIAIRCSTPASKRPCAPIGTWHPPSKVASRDRSAVTAALVSA